MQLFIVRHAEAELQTTPDINRQLSSEGRQECEKIGQWISSRQAHFDLVLISPYLRAQQTWLELTKQGITTKCKVDLEELVPDASPDKAANVVLAYCDNLDSVLVVTHLPLVCHLVAELAHGEVPLFATGATALLEINHDHLKGNIIGMTSPYQLSLAN